MESIAYQALSHALAKEIGQENLAFDDLHRHLYSTDASSYQIMPIGVVFPRHEDDVCAIHEITKQYNAPILPRGTGSSLAGQAVGPAVIIDFTRHMRRVRSINADAQTIEIETGLVLDQMNRQLQPLGLMFGPDPASSNRATLGGCLANNSTGTHSILYRMTSDHVRWVDVVLASGEKVRLGQGATQNHTLRHLTASIQDILQRYAHPIATNYPKVWRNVAGYALNRLEATTPDLAQLIIGSEGTLGSIVRAELSLVERPKFTRLAILHFATLKSALEIVPPLLETAPSAIELLDKSLLYRTRILPEFSRRLHFVEGDPAALLIVEYYGDSEAELSAKIEHLKRYLSTQAYRGATRILIQAAEQADVWIVRKAGLGLLASIRGDTKPLALIEDAAVPVEYLATYIEGIEAIIKGEGAEMSIYAHASAGCLHVRPALNLKTSEGLRQYRAIAEQAANLALEFGGTTSSEHGEGLVRGEFSEKLFGTALTQAFREVKQLFDPENRLNPHKIIDLFPMDDPTIMRYNPSYSTPYTLHQPYYDWSSDNGFAGAIEMCNGAGVCRKEDSGTMCPSFMATRNEADSTRGRANILRLAMTGKLGIEGLQHPYAKQVLDLCLSCKACKAECPSSVDMASIKAEFMAAYQTKNGVSWRTRLFANIHRINPLLSIFPRFANLAMNLPIISRWMKHFMGIAPQRRLPYLAPQRFSRWAKQHSSSEQNVATPILIVDTFTEFYYPEIGQALYYLAEKLQLKILTLRLPNQACCGRPAISKGILWQAKEMANQNVDFLADLIDQNPNTRFMMLEPSCLSAFKDDYINLVDSHLKPQAEKLAKALMSVEEWLHELCQKNVFENLAWDYQARQLILHGHCHQKALWGTQASLALLKAIPMAAVQELDAGCCGMAGSFGYEHYDTSIQIAQKRLYPAIQANPSTIFVASGASCREQVAHIQQKAYHPIEIIASACGWTWQPKR